MARRVLIIPTLISIAFSIALFLEATVFAADYSARSVAELNEIFNRTGPPGPAAVVEGDTVTLTITTPNDSDVWSEKEYGVWSEWRSTDVMNGLTGRNFTLTVNKNGIGNWRLGTGTELLDPDTGQPLPGVYMANVLISGTGTNTFNVNAGILDLMRGTTLQLTGAAAGSRFTVASGASVNARGANQITLTGPGIELGNNSTLGFDLTHRDSNYTTGTPILTIAGTLSKLDTTDQVNINLLGFADIESPVRVTLLQYNYDASEYVLRPPIYAGNHNDPEGIGSDIYANRRLNPILTPNLLDRSNLYLQVRGENWDDVVTNSGGRLSGRLEQSPYPVATGSQSLILTNFHSDIGIATWNGSENNRWNATSQNWTVTGNLGANTFLHGDTARFVGGLGAQSIEVQRGGVQIGGARNAGEDASGNPITIIGNMEVSGGIYDFQNEEVSPGVESLIGIDGRGQVYIHGMGTEVTFHSENSYWGGTRIEDGGLLRVRTAHSLGTGFVEMRTGAQLIFDIDTNVTVRNSISGEVGTDIIKEGIGNVFIDNTVMGAINTEVREGTLTNNIGSGLLTVYLGATYVANTTVTEERRVAGLSDGPVTEFFTRNGGTIDLGEGKLIVNVGQGWDYAFSGTIIGTGRLIKEGRYAQILRENANYDDSTYSGGTEIVDGALVVQWTLDVDRQIYPLGTGEVRIQENGTLQFDIVGDSGALDPADLVATFDNAIHGSGRVLKRAFPETDPPRAHAAVLNLTSSTSSYTGRTDVHEGTLRLGSVNATGATLGVYLAADAVLQLDMDDTTAMAPYNRIITGAGNVEVLTGPATLPDGRTVYVSGTNDYQPNESNYTGTTTVMDEVTLHLLNAQGTGKTSQVNLVTDLSTLVLDFNQDQTYDRHIVGDGNLTKTGAGTATLNYDPEKATSVPNAYTGWTTVRAGTLRLLYADATGAKDAPGDQSVTVTGQGILELAFDGDYDKGIGDDTRDPGNIIKATGGIAKSGAGTVTRLQGWNTYTGGTYIWGGTLSFTDTDTDFDNHGNLGEGRVFFQRGGGTLRNTKLNPMFDRGIEIDAGSTAIFDTLENMTILGDGGISHRPLDPSDPYYDPTNTGSHFVKRGAADLTIETTAVDWRGRTTVQNGRLINNIPNGTELTVSSPGEYVTGNADRIVSLLLGNGTVQTAKDYNFVVDNAVDNTFEGSIQGLGNLVKSGKGLFVLTGNNFYNGETIIQDGILRGNIATQAALVVGGYGTYEAGDSDRAVRSLSGSGTVDMQGNTLSINMPSGEATFGGRIINGQQLWKSGFGKQILGGTFYDFSNNVHLKEGTLQIGADASTTSVLQTAGSLAVDAAATLAVNPLAKINITNKLTIDGTFSVNVGGNIAHANEIVHADEVELGPESTINIAGITSASETWTILRSNNDIVGQFKNVTVAGDPSPDVDFLIFGVSYEDPKAVKVGQTLRWYSGTDAHGTFTLNDPDGVYDVGVSLRDVKESSRRLPTWDGTTLTKRGLGTLVLSASNTYSGETRVQEGTLKLTHAEATLGSSQILLGTTEVPNAGALELDFNGSMDTWIAGTGSGVYKTGDSVVVLTGRNTYIAPTEVRQGSLYIDDWLTSHVWVNAGAGFGGNGRVNETVTFRDGSFFDWRFGTSEAQSDLLTVSRLDIGNDVRVRPNTNIPSLEGLANFADWKILRYDGYLNNYFVGVENGANPYYDFELDYSEHGWVKISGFLRHEPRALSDIVATSVMMAQTRMYRSVFQQIEREWTSDCPDHPTVGRGQTPRSYRAAWMNFVGRGDQFASNYFSDQYKFQSYGVQVGFSLFSNCQNSFGIMFGREEGKLANYSDEVRGEDNYLGLYYGRAFNSDLDFRGYVGGGWQSNRLKRRSNGNLYHANYGGSTYNVDLEFGRRFLTEREWVLRPFLGFDVAVAQTGRGMETCEANPTSNEYRAYGRSSLTQVLTRAGAELGKNWRLLDFNSGLHLAWNWGDTVPKTTIYYPVTGGSVVGRGVDIGRFDLVMNVGVNWYITPQRHTMFYLHYIGDLHLDRKGDTGGSTGTVGFSWRF